MHSVVVGLGKTGASCLRYLAKRGIPVSATDTRRAPPGLVELGALAKSLDLRLGGFDLSLLDGASQVLMSPGVSLEEPIARAARDRGIDVLGDVELFARNVQAPVIGITGTNGKSTVTTLLARMAQRAGLAVRVGGNLGEPALDLLSPGTALYVLELSSFQLETTTRLACRAATVLNVSADHLDRYASIGEYAAAKARIFARCDTAVVNLDDPLVMAMPRAARRTLSFSLRAAVGADYAVAMHAGGWWLTRAATPLLPVARMKIKGLHNAANALAALALGEALELPFEPMLRELEEFAGLPHRSQWVAEVRGVTYINDSKGTNVGATLAAVGGMAGPLIMIAGGDGKNQDFAPLAAAFRGKVRHAVLIGRDAARIERALAGVCTLETAATLPEAVRAAARAAQPGDTVLLSPACASLDMFRDYTERGAVFTEAVGELAA
jgi:UDP-N-acetylmuramoylalanine--D-glutamate ligase